MNRCGGIGSLMCRDKTPAAVRESTPTHCPHLIAGVDAPKEQTMKSMFNRREKFLYRRNPLLDSFISGTKFGIVVAALALLAAKLA